jgi:hypothetical protein
MSRSNLSLPSLSLCLVLIFAGRTALADATCENDLQGSKGTVVVGDNHQIVVSGLKQKGIASGTYMCRVLGVGPGILSEQSQLECEKKSNPAVKLSVWIIQGFDFLGRPAASVALYDTTGSKVFESPCSKD